MQLKSLKDRLWTFQRWTWALTDFQKKETWGEAQSSGPIIVLGTHLRWPFAPFFLSLGQDLILFLVQDMEVRNKTSIYTEIMNVHQWICTGMDKQQFLRRLLSAVNVVPLLQHFHITKQRLKLEYKVVGNVNPKWREWQKNVTIKIHPWRDAMGCSWDTAKCSVP